MTVRPGQYGSVFSGLTSFGTAAGKTIALNNSEWAVLNSIYFRIVSTATAGSRLPVLQIKDSVGNILFYSTTSATIPASSTFVWVWCAGAPNVYFLTNGATMPLPVEMPVPTGATITIFDNINVDPTDTITINAVFAM